MKKITRTIEHTYGKILVANTDTHEMYEKEFLLPGTFSSEKELLKEIITETSEYPLKVVSSGQSTKKYVISLEDFIKYATEIDED